MKKLFLILTATVVLSVLGFSQAQLKDDFARSNRMLHIDKKWVTMSGFGAQAGWQLYAGAARPNPTVGRDSVSLDTTTTGWDTKGVLWDTLNTGNFEFGWTVSRTVQSNAILQFWIASKAQDQYYKDNSGSRGYRILYQWGGTPDNWTVKRYLNGYDDASDSVFHSITWKKAASVNKNMPLVAGDRFKIQVRKDVNVNTIALLKWVGGGYIVQDSIQDNEGAGGIPISALNYVGIYGTASTGVVLDDFVYGPYLFIAPGPTPPDSSNPYVNLSTSPQTGQIDSLHSVVVSASWNDLNPLYNNGGLKTDTIWVTGYAHWGLLDTFRVVNTTLNNALTNVISIPSQTYAKGVHYYWSSARDTSVKSNYFKSPVASFTVGETLSATNMWVTGYWLCYAQGGNDDPRTFGNIDWTTWTHIIHQSTDPSRTQIPDPLHPEAHYYTYGCGYAAFTTNLRAMIDSAHARGRFVLLGLGGTGGRVNDFDWIVQNGHLSEYVNSCMNLARLWGYDGFDFDIEPPMSSPDGVQRTYDILRMFSDSAKTLPRGRIISFALPPWNEQWTLRADSALQWIDQFNVMNYDYSLNSQNSVTEYNTPLYPYDCPSTPRSLNLTNNLWYQDSMYVKVPHGGGGGLIPKSRLGVGLAFYGYRWNAENICRAGTGVNSTTSYAYIHNLYNTAGTAYRYHWDPVVSSPYLAWQFDDGTSDAVYNLTGTQRFITFDDTNSIAIKSRWAKDQGYGGLMVWALYYEEAGHPLVKAINKGLGGGTIGGTGEDFVSPVVILRTINDVPVSQKMYVTTSIIPRVDATDNVQLISVAALIDGNITYTLMGPGPTFTFFGLTLPRTPQQHVLTFRAQDASGNIGYSAPETVLVQPVVITRPPAVPQLLTPVANAAITTMATILTVQDTSCNTTCSGLTKWVYQVKANDTITTTNFAFDSSGSVASYTVNALVAGTTYWWRAGAKNDYQVNPMYSWYRKFTVSASPIPKTFHSLTWDRDNWKLRSPSNPASFTVTRDIPLSSLAGELVSADSSYLLWSPNGVIRRGQIFPSVAGGLLSSAQTVSGLWTFSNTLTATTLNVGSVLTAPTGIIGTLSLSTPLHNIELNPAGPFRFNTITNTLSSDSASRLVPGVLLPWSYGKFMDVVTTGDTTHSIKIFDDFNATLFAEVLVTSVAGGGAIMLPAPGFAAIGAGDSAGSPPERAFMVQSVPPTASDSGRMGIISLDPDSLRSGQQNGTRFRGGMMYAYYTNGGREIIDLAKNGNEFTVSVKFGTVNDSMAVLLGFFNNNDFTTDWTNNAVHVDDAIFFEYKKVASGAAGDSVYGCTQFGATKTKVGLFVPVFNGATWNKLTFRTRGTSVDFYVNGLYKKTISTNLPSATKALSRGMGIYNYDASDHNLTGTGGTGKAIYIDYDEFKNATIIR